MADEKTLELQVLFPSEEVINPGKMIYYTVLQSRKFRERY